ncbi:MAG: hypothetical protein GWN55_01710 [Phycisphaerae bacterium]|nr:hypothetical protein [candidate division KSB1 bacterium]NIV00049.1 hypothetical protein [Phycisphaerae bacterium]NIS23052.1 hypothetical protein [candidate division KSB1 bacterium]NIT69905.1 hypothetical protein [candidate division KSB1 bacterium]NIU23570.1 hypothetical protein [candidate division KSB1 bacterium]
MLQRLISYSVNFIKVVGSLVTGFTALFYAAGFLAWNSRLVYLGMPEPEIVNVNYLITGAQFFVSLPLRLIVGLYQFLNWGWTLWTLLLFIALIAWLGTWVYNRRFSKGAFLVIGVLLLLLLLTPFRDDGEFFKHLPDPSEPGALFNPDITPWEELANNYSKLIVFTILALVGSGLMLSWQKKIEEATPSSETAEIPPSGFRYILYGMGRAISNFVPLLIAIPTLIYILMLPMNFVHPVFTQRYPVVQISFNQKEIYPEIRPTTELFLLKQAKGNLLFYSRLTMKMWQVKEANIKELSIIGVVECGRPWFSRCFCRLS